MPFFPLSMAASNRQRLIIGVLKHFLQDSAEDFAGAVCDESGLNWAQLRNVDLEQFATTCATRIAPLVGKSKARFVSGVITKLQERGV